jgi:hypothetical protein
MHDHCSTYIPSRSKTLIPLKSITHSITLHYDNDPLLYYYVACSSSLTAVHVALNSIRCGDCDVAVVAAADLLISDHCLKVKGARIKI